MDGRMTIFYHLTIVNDNTACTVWSKFKKCPNFIYVDGISYVNMNEKYLVHCNISIILWLCVVRVHSCSIQV